MIDVCKCQHAVDSHHEKKYGCLAIHCECQKYRSSEDTERDIPTIRIMKAYPVIGEWYK